MNLFNSHYHCHRKSYWRREITFDSHTNVAAFLEPAGWALLPVVEVDLAVRVTHTFKFFLVLHGSLKKSFARLACLHTIVESCRYTDENTDWATLYRRDRKFRNQL